MVSMHDRRPAIVLWAALAAFLCWHYGALLSAPNSVLLAAKGDGIKNYYTYAWQIEHANDPWSFDGMNHPYGEHVFFTDGHPALAWMLGALDKVFPSVGEHAIGILNVLLIAGIALAGFVVFLLLRELGARPWQAVALSFGMAVLAPQTMRLGGHLALSWSVCLPLTWWLVLRSMRSPRPWLWSMACAASTLFWLLTHAYLGVMAALFGAGIALMLVIQRGQWKTILGPGAVVVGIAVLPVALFTVLRSATDTHSGRSEHPSGFFNYTAEPDDLLVPNAPPLRPWLDQLTDHAISTQWEASAYLGLGTVLVWLVWLSGRVVRGPNKQKDLFPAGARAAWPPAVLLLLFAFCFPFKTWPSLLELAPVAEQFRALGRFTWPFWYTCLVCSALIIERWSHSAGTSPKHLALRALPFLLSASWLVEGWHAHASLSTTLHSGNPFSARSVVREELVALGIDRLTQHQAMLPLPYFNFGSESFTRPSLDDITQAALPISHHLRMPILGSILSRVSVPESRSLTQLVSASWYAKPAHLLHPGRPVLIVRSGGTLTTNERAIMAQAVHLGRCGNAELYSIQPAALLRNTANEELTRFANTRTSLVQRQDLLLSDTLSAVHHIGFDDRSGTPVLQGNGALEVPKNGTHVLGQFKLLGVDAGDTLVASAWFHNALPEALNHGLRFEAVQGDHIVSVLPNETENIDGDWSLVHLVFTAAFKDPDVELRTVCNGYLDRPLVIDELYIRRFGQDVYRETTTIVNGHPVIYRNGHRIARPYP